MLLPFFPVTSDLFRFLVGSALRWFFVQPKSLIAQYLKITVYVLETPARLSIWTHHSFAIPLHRDVIPLSVPVEL